LPRTGADAQRLNQAFGIDVTPGYLRVTAARALASMMTPECRVRYAGHHRHDDEQAGEYDSHGQIR
jgi:hypothetical protein